jgi:glutaredoxin
VVISRFLIIGQRNCTYCDKAKALMKKHDISYLDIDIDQATWLKEILKRSEFKTVPIIFGYSNELIGGYSELEKHLND